MTGQDLGDDAKVDKRGTTDLQAMGNSSTQAVDVETKFALGILGTEIDFADRSINSLGGDDEVVDELLHTQENIFLFG